MGRFNGMRRGIVTVAATNPDVFSKIPIPKGEK
jgi:hypothetical protein